MVKAVASRNSGLWSVKAGEVGMQEGWKGGRRGKRWLVKAVGRGEGRQENGKTGKTVASGQ